MNRAFRTLAPLALAPLALMLVALAACAPAKTPQSAAPVAAAPAPPLAAAPAKHATMICRNSQDGRKVACGTPNAVMVGIKDD